MSDHQSTLLKWEFRIAYLIVLTTPFVISLATVDSYILPKHVWLAFWTTLGFILLALHSSMHKHIPSSIDIPLFVMVIVFVLSIILNYRTPIQIRVFFRLFVFIALFYYFRKQWIEGLSAVAIAWLLLLVSLLLSVHGILQDYGIDFAASFGGVRDWRAKVISTLGNPNFLGGFLAVVLPVLIAFGSQQKLKWWKFLLVWPVVLLNLACLALTFCVGATIGLFCALIVTLLIALFYRVSFTFSKTRFTLLILAGLIGCGWYLLDNPYNSHGRSLYREAWESPQWWSGMGARRFNWRTTRIMIDENPITGIGYGNYLTVHEHYQGINYKIQDRAHDRDYVIPVDQPHFQLLETASEIGPFGVFALLWLFIAWFKSALNKLINVQENKWFAWGSFFGVITIVAHSFSSFPFHLPATSLLAVLLASHFVVPQKIKQAKTYSLPNYVLWTLSGFLILICISNYLELLGSKKLREGLETPGILAIPHLEEARLYDPYSYQTHFTLGVKYYEEGWNKKAIQSFEKAIELQEDLNSHRYLADIYLRMNDIPAAIRELRRVLELNPAFPGHYRDLAELLRKNGQNEEAEKLEAKGEELEKQMDQ